MGQIRRSDLGKMNLQLMAGVENQNRAQRGENEAHGMKSFVCRAREIVLGGGIKGNRLRYVKRIWVMLLIIAILLLILWGGGFAFHVAGGLVHLLLVIALIVLILHFVRGRGV
jgi:hypothetical protein